MRGVLGKRGEFPSDRMARLVEVPGDLEGQPAALGHPLLERAEELEVSRDPLQGGVRHDDVGPVSPCGPLLDPADREVHPVGPASGADHGLAGVDPLDPGGGPALCERQRQISRPAAEVDDGARPLGRHASDQVEEGSAALVGVAQVRARVPGVHGPTLYLDIEICGAFVTPCAAER